MGSVVTFPSRDELTARMLDEAMKRTDFSDEMKTEFKRRLVVALKPIHEAWSIVLDAPEPAFFATLDAESRRQLQAYVQALSDDFARHFVGKYKRCILKAVFNEAGILVNARNAGLAIDDGNECTPPPTC